MDDHQSSSGFSPHLLNQLGQASEQVSHSQRGYSRGRFPRGRTYSSQPRQAPANDYYYQGPPPSRDAFPPLGSQSTSSQSPSSASSISNYSNIHQPPIGFQGHQRNVDRGRTTHHFQPSRPYQHQPGYGARQYQSQPQPQSVDAFRRPPAPHGQLYQQNSVSAANPWASSSDQQRLFRNQVMAQVDYLNRTQQETRSKYQLKQDEQIAKETFRRRLETFFQETLLKQYPDLDTKGIRLRCYGSLNNGFGLAGCDMDLLLTLPDSFTPTSTTLLPDYDSTSKAVTDARKPTAPPDDASTTEDMADSTRKESFEVGWLLEGALLDSQIGARLLTKTRVPILKICESPSGELLQNLRQCRADQLKTEIASAVSHSGTEATFPPLLDLEALDNALKDLGDQKSAAEVALPTSPPKRTGSSIEFDGDFGIKCDVNFSNNVAIHNTRLLREYCLIDPRVAQVGVFVKSWAKIRDINTPYYGTLSSYGYVLMVLHYLMNVVNPPVIPNLQHIARDQDAWTNQTSVDLFEGKYDIRFLADKEKIAEYRESLGQNRESTGNLLRGFFWYYSNHQGFNWKNDTISIRTKGGIVKKFAKGWTEAKWAGDSEKKNVRLRYLMAIEDPFETEHNVARVVGHSGIVAIRDEFRRAWNIISNIGVEGAIVEDLMKPVESRGDLLRKDQDHHREKMKQMRQAVEAKERNLKEAAMKESTEGQETGMSSDSEVLWTFRSNPTNRRTSNSKLTGRVPTSQTKPMQYSSRVRKVIAESDEEGDDGEVQREAENSVSSKKDSVVQVNEVKTAEESGKDNPGPFCTSEDINYARGLDGSGAPIAWDLSTQDGRWLQWRDNKIKGGEWRGSSRPDEIALDEACPFDARRPKGEPPADVRPPFPLNKYEAQGSTSCTRSFYVTRNLRRPSKDFKAHISRSARLAAANSVSVNSSPINWIAPISSPITDAAPENPVPVSNAATDTAAVSTSPVSTAPVEVAPTSTSPPEVAPFHTVPVNTTPVNTSPISIAPPGKAVDNISPSNDTPMKSPRANALYWASRKDELTTLPIRWYWFTDGGKWLRKRDSLIRYGGFDLAHLDDWHRRLHLEFPYQTEMTRGELGNFNKKLKKDWKWQPKIVDRTESKSVTSQTETLSSTLPAEGKEMMSQVLNELKKLSRELHYSKGSQPGYPQLPTVSSTSPRTEVEVHRQLESKVDSVSETMPSSAFIRSRRLAYFALQQQRAISQEEIEADAKDNNVQTLMKEAGIDIHRPKLTKGDSTTGIWASSDSEQTDARVSEVSKGVSQSTTATSTEGVKPNQEPAVSNAPHVKTESQAKVPLTLCPDVPAEERPPHENPNIMPIPQQVDFKFDLRQLQDLAVIQAGGNGCARAGQQFEIEIDYEWGGGGEMGYRSSSGMPQSSSLQKSYDVYEYGRGDEEGLLNELPGVDE